MIISDLKCTDVGRVRISANVTFEDCDQPEKEIFIETPGEFGSDLSLNPAAPTPCWTLNTQALA